MIVTDLLEAADSGSKDVHQLISDSMGTYPQIEVQDMWRDYAIGEMTDQVSAARRAALGLRTHTTPMQNMIRQCIKQIVGRLRFERFVVEHEETQKFLDEYAIKNKMTQKVVQIGRRQLVDGNTALSQVWRGGSGGMAIVRQEYWMDENSSGIFVAVDDANDPVWAISDYVDNDDVSHRILYLPDRILHYTGGSVQGEGWELRSEEDWTTSDNVTGIGMPVSHFPNAEIDFGPYGSSTVKEVISVQDSLNLNLFNRMAVSAASGQQILWGTGINPPEDAVYGPGSILSSKDPASRFGAIEPGSMDGVIHETDDLRGVVSGAFPVPSYRLGSGDWPSGLALQRSDGPMLTMVQMVREIQTTGLVHHAHRATIMANTFGGYNLDPEALITVEWTPADDLDPSTETEILAARAETLALAESLSEPSLRKLGMFSEEEIEAIIKERELREEEVLADAGDDDEDFA